MLTPRQIQWASQHDWFVSVLGSDGLIIVKDDYVLDGKLHTQHIIWTESFSDLRDWAGY